MNKYKAILFDYDGTLMDTNELVMASWQYMAQTLIGHKLPEAQLLATYGVPLEDAMERIRIQFNLNVTSSEMCNVYRSYQMGHIKEQRRLFGGVAEMLKAVKEKDIKTGIVTSRFNASTEEGLKAFDIWKYFDAMIGSNDTDVHKPNPEPALLCCRKLGVDPAECLMVGDSVFDLQCGHNAGSDACFVSWSVCTSVEKAVAEANPDYIINTPQELMNIVY